MPPAHRLRLARPSDEKTYLELRRTLWPDTPLEIHAEEFRKYCRGKHPGGLEVPCAPLLVEGLSGELIGILEISLRPFVNGCSHPPVGFIEALWVVPEYRELGWGDALLHAAKEWTRGFGGGEVMTELHPRDEDLPYHLELGFVELSRQITLSIPIDHYRVVPPPQPSELE